MLKRLIFFALVLLFSSANAEVLGSYKQAKQAARQIFSEMSQTVYCGCKYDAELNIQLNSCGYNVRRNKQRASRVEWEHIVPAENFARGKQLNCWAGKNKRKNCLKTSKEFRTMHNNLHNLIPIIGELNGDRSNYRFANLATSDFNYGCAFKINFKSRKVEPPDAAKGVVARANLYFSDKYKLPLSKQQRLLFNDWDTKFPPQAWEYEWNEQVYKVQGDYNKFILNHKKCAH